MTAFSSFVEIGIIVGITVIVSALMRAIKQPLIIGYIITGILVSPFALNIIKATDTIYAFSQIGIALLLFIVGLNLNPKVNREIGIVALVTGIGQMTLTFLAGIVLSLAFGFSYSAAIYVAIAMSFSSTIIVMKLLSDMNKLETLYGKITIGHMLVQDLAAILVLLFIPSLSTAVGVPALLFSFIVKGGLLIILILLIGYFVIPRVTNFIASSHESFFIFSIGWCLALAALFDYLGFSLEIGSLLAGVTLSTTRFSHEISLKVKPLRDFFIIMFFVLLGAQMKLNNIAMYLLPALLLSLCILVVKPFSMMAIMGALGYTKRNSFLAGLAIAQVSEFSLIIAALGAKVGHVSEGITALVTITALITITCSTYLISHADNIYSHISNYLSVFERKGKKIDAYSYHKGYSYEVILFGCNRIGSEILELFRNNKHKLLAIDFNPDIIRSLAREGFECKYGDAEDAVLFDELDLRKTKMVVSTIPDKKINSFIIDKVRAANKDIIIIAVSHRVDDALELYSRGASYVLLPYFLGSRHAAILIKGYGYNKSKFLKAQSEQIKSLKKKKKIGHEHPLHERIQ